MRKREILLVVLLIAFGLIDQAIRDEDLGLIREGRFSFLPSRLATNRFVEYKTNDAVYPNIEQVIVDNPAGSIVVEKAVQNSVIIRVAGKLYFRNPQKARKLWNQVQIDKNVQDKILRISILQPKPFPYDRLRVNIQIEIPENIKIKISNSFGLVSIQDAGKEIEVNEKSGNIKIAHINSDLIIHGEYSNIQITDISKKLTLDARSCKISVQKVQEVDFQGKFCDAEIKSVSKEIKVKQSYQSLWIEDGANIDVDALQTHIVMRNIREKCRIANRHDSVELFQANGDVIIETIGCNIKVSEGQLDHLKVSNTDDDVSIQNSRLGSADIQVKRGNVIFFPRELRDELKIEGRHSDIELGFAKMLTASFDIQAEQGQIIDDTSLNLLIKKEKIVESISRIAQKPRLVVHSIYGNINLKGIEK